MYDGTIPSGVAILKDKYRLNKGTISQLLGLDITTLDDDYMSNYTDQTNHAEYALPFLVGALDATSDDAKLSGVIDGFMHYFDLSIEALALYAEITPAEMKNFISDPSSLSIEKKIPHGNAIYVAPFRTKRILPCRGRLRKMKI
ncbi:HTH domain-containing protein [Listeria booriae]|uniref:HTH domain-containing protein n=1 Tax=Listeria booriae TaxID=1552123 RepID=UPI001629D34D|nr:HTH domain-containing protein [Listeria booriae]MBC2304612.1 hypothetical protein [Listeria booriae]